MPVAKPITDVAEIQRRMAQIRHDMHQEVQGAVKGAQLLTDWRSLVKSYPWLSISLAAVAGYLIVPRRKSIEPPTLDPKLAALERIAISQAQAPPPQPKRSSWSVIGTAFSLLAPVAVRAAQNYALGHLEQWLSQNPLSPSPSGSPDGPGRDHGRPAPPDATNRLRQFG